MSLLFVVLAILTCLLFEKVKDVYYKKSNGLLKNKLIISIIQYLIVILFLALSFVR